MANDRDPAENYFKDLKRKKPRSNLKEEILSAVRRELAGKKSAGQSKSAGSPILIYLPLLLTAAAILLTVVVLKERRGNKTQATQTVINNALPNPLQDCLYIGIVDQKAKIECREAGKKTTKELQEGAEFRQLRLSFIMESQLTFVDADNLVHILKKS